MAGRRAATAGRGPADGGTRRRIACHRITGGDPMTETIIDNPTYLEHIRHFFTDEDLDHMSQRGHDLSTYQGLRKDAVSVSQLTAPPDASMPPPETGRAWSTEHNQSF